MSTNQLAELKTQFELWLSTLSRGKQQAHFPTFLEIVKTARETADKERSATRGN